MTDNTPPTLQIRLFRAFNVSLSDHPITKFEADTARALLAYLSTRPGKPIARELLAQILWDAEDGANALTNLRSALRRLRTAIETASNGSALPDYLVADRTTLMFNTAAPSWVDVLEFERLLEQVQRHQHASGEECTTCIELLRQAIALYRGEFLPDITLDTVGFEEWRRIERERLQRMALYALHRLGEHAFRSGAFAEAEQIARRQLDLEPWNEEAHRQLMRVLFASGRRTAALAQYQSCRRMLVEELGVDPDDETETLYLRLLAGESPTPRAVGQIPYKGLSPFGPEDADVFFGRDCVTDNLHEAVLSQSAVMVIGPSGSGKSSVINAGLIPVLLGRRGGKGEAPGDDQATVVWQVQFMRPGSNPLATLDEVLSVAPGAALEGQPAGQVRRLLVVDQFEELFTVCEDSAMRTAFLERLLSPNATRPITALLAMRADFVGDALRYGALTDLLQYHTIVLGPLSRGDLQQVIEEPARLRGVAFEPGLVERLLQGIGDTLGQLPLLQFALAQLWERQSDGWVTHEAFDAIGRVRGALARYADDIFAELTPDAQEQARHIFLSLVQPTADAQDIRRMATRAELGETRWPLVQRLADARLLVTNHTALGGETVELVHETLIRAWQRLQEWLETDREFQTWKQRTRIRMESWSDDQSDDAALLRGSQLFEAERWQAERADEIEAPLQRYIAVGVTARDELQQREEAARARELANAQALAEAEHQRAESEARSRRRLIWLSVGLALLMVIAVLTALYAFTAQQLADAERRRAEENARTALARQLGAQSTNAQETAIDLALLLNQEALRLDSNVRDDAELLFRTDVDPRLRKILHGESRAIYGTAIQADDASVLAHNESGSIVSWDSATGQRTVISPASPAESQGVVFSPSGDSMVTWRNGVVTVRTSASAAPLFEIAVPAGIALYSMAFSTDGSRVVSYWSDGAFRLFDAATGDLLEEHAMDLAELELLAVASPDGYSVVVADEKDNIPLLQLWDMRTATSTVTFPQHHVNTIHQVSASPAGSLLATASYDGSVRLWEIATGEQKGDPLLGHTARVLFANFSPDGKMLVSGGTDNRVIVWDVASGQPIGQPLRGHGNWVRTGAFSRDNKQLATGDIDARVLLWDVGMMQELQGHDDVVRAVTLSPDERTLVTAGFDKQLIIRDGATLETVRQVATEHQNAILTAGFSPDGKTFATADAGGLLILWDTATWRPRHVIRSEEKSELIGLDFTPDSQRVATGAFNGIVDVRDVVSGQSVVEPFHAFENDWALSLRFSPDGRRLYTGSSDHTIRMWDAQTFAPLGEPLQGHTNWVTDLALTPDGQTLVSASTDQTIRLWDANSGAPLGEALLGHKGPVWSVNFRTVNDRLALVSLGNDGSVVWWDWETRTPMFPPLRTGHEFDWMRLSTDGRRLLLGSSQSQAFVVEPDLAPWPERACAIANRNLTEAEWSYFIPDLPYQSICPPGANEQSSP